MQCKMFVFSSHNTANSLKCNNPEPLWKSKRHLKVLHINALLSYLLSFTILHWYWSNFTIGRFQQVAVWIHEGAGWLACLLTYWLVRSASQERFYDVHYWSKSKCGPQTSVNPSELLGLTASWLFSGSPVVSVWSPSFSNNEDSAELTVELMSHHQNGHIWLFPTATSPPVW